MKNRMRFLIVFVLIISLLEVGCGAKNEETKDVSDTSMALADKDKDNDKEVQQSSNQEDSEKNMEKLLKEAADKEGVSSKELAKTLDALAELGGEKYGLSKEDYIKQLEDSGSSVLEEWTLASEVMGLSITELYEYEKSNVSNLSDEDKETMAAMAGALDEIGAIDLEQVEDEEAINALLGITENNGEVIAVNGEFKDVFYYKADEVNFEYQDEYSITVEYESKEDPDKILEYYVDLLSQTKDYMLLAQAGIKGGMIQATFNDMTVFIEVLEMDSASVSCYLDLSSKN